MVPIGIAEEELFHTRAGLEIDPVGDAAFFEPKFERLDILGLEGQVVVACLDRPGGIGNVGIDDQVDLAARSCKARLRRN